MPWRTALQNVAYGLELRKEFKSLVKGSGKTGVFVTHSIAEAIEISERVLVFRSPVSGSTRGRPNRSDQPAQTGGWRRVHGRSPSICEARRNSVASSPNRPMYWLPTGSPSGVQYVGTAMAGCPVAFAK